MGSGKDILRTVPVELGIRQLVLNIGIMEKEHGNCYNILGLYRDDIRIMETKMETTTILLYRVL